MKLCGLLKLCLDNKSSSGTAADCLPVAAAASCGALYAPAAGVLMCSSSCLCCGALSGWSAVKFPSPLPALQGAFI